VHLREINIASTPKCSSVHVPHQSMCHLPEFLVTHDDVQDKENTICAHASHLHESMDYIHLIATNNSLAQSFSNNVPALMALQHVSDTIYAHMLHTQEVLEQVSQSSSPRSSVH
jgi:hypothetical protein